MTDVYRIGVTIALVNNVSAVLGVIQRDVLGLRKQVNLLSGDFTAAKLAVVGFGSALAGGAVLGAMAKLVEHGKEFVHQQALMNAAGMNQQEIAQATAQAYKTMGDVLTSSVSDNMKSIRELRMVFGDTQDAMRNLTAVTKAQSVMESVRGTGAGDQVFDMAKALEIKGVSMDPAHFKVLLDSMVQAAIASGGRVMGTDFFSAFKYGRTATLGWSDTFVGNILPTLIQEMKGGGGSGSGTGGPGNALQSMFQAVVGGVMSNKAAEEFLKLGLLDKSKIISTSTGNIKGISPGGVMGSAEFERSPYDWAQDFLVPALQKAGITDPEKVREEVAHLFVNRTAQQIATMFTTQQMRFEKDAAIKNQATTTDLAYEISIAKDPTAKLKAFTAAWDNLVTTLGRPITDDWYNMLLKLAKVMNDFTQWAARNQQIVGIIEKAAAGLGGLAVALGAFAIGGAAAKALGLLTGPVGLAALAVGIAAFGSSVSSLPPWLIGMASGAAAGAGVGLRFGGAPGAAVGAIAGGFLGTIGTGTPAPPGYHYEPDANGLSDSLHPDKPTAPTGSAARTAAPQQVVVVNPQDIGNAVGGGLARGASRPPAGPTAADPRLYPSTPGVPAY